MGTEENPDKYVPSKFDCNNFNAVIDIIKSWPKPEQLYKSLFYEGDIAMLIGPPCCGKSLYALMIAEDICKIYEEAGVEYFGVLYFDLEMETRQYYMRLWDGKAKHIHKFPDQLYRVRIYEDERHKIIEEFMLIYFKELIITHSAKVIIIDNFSYLCKNLSGASAAAFMRNLKILRDFYGVSFLVVAHTEMKNSWKPITLADIKGKDFLATIPDSVFALNMSRKGKDVRYVKQLKSRCSEIEYGQDNVMEYKIGREKDGMLRLIFQGTTTEEEQIDIDYEAKQNLENKIKLLKSEGMSIREIADELKVSPSKVWRCLNREK